MNNNNSDVGREVLAMLCGVVPPEYREGVKPPLVAPAKQTDGTMRSALPEEIEPARRPVKPVR